MKYPYLDKIQKNGDVKKLPQQELPLLCEDIRNFLIESVSSTGGHLSSNLGVVELTVALHRALTLPQDKILFDVGHQCYTHKLLTGRREGFAHLRQVDGLSGFPSPQESDCDTFIAGHGSTALSTAIGVARAKKLKKEPGKVVAIIGDGAFTGGMVYEGMNNVSNLNNLIVVLNDNKMSISKNVGQMANYLTKLRTDPKYFRVKVIATGRRAEPIEQTIAEIKELGGEGFAFACDSADRARVEEVVKAAAEKYGTVDVVVNNAQAIVPSAPVEETSYDNMLKAWQSGVIGSLNYMQAAFPYMKEQHEGRIINFASATGMFGIAGQLAYGSNKEALRGMTKIAAKEWGQYGICVNIVLPGAESPAAKAWAEKFPEEYAKQVNLNPMKRFGDPEIDIAPVIAFLAGPDSCYFSGQSVIVDGANSIMP